MDFEVQERIQTFGRFLVVFCLVGSLLGFCTYLQYEPTLETSTTVNGVVTDYHFGSDARGDKSATYSVKLENGLVVKVKAVHSLPSLYRGEVVLTLMKGASTGRDIYRINESKTKEFRKE